MRALDYIKIFVWDVLFPSLCLGCSDESGILCPPCLEGLIQKAALPACFWCGLLVPQRKRTPPGRTCSSCRRKSQIYAFLSPLNYQDELARRLIHSLKYGRQRDVGRLLGEILAEYSKFWGVKFGSSSAVVALPLHPARERTRGFNQSLIIASSLSERLNVRLEDGALKRIQKTKTQTGLGWEERKKNVLGSFAVITPEAVKGRTIVLVDDVKTTGATLEEAAQVLKKAGAKGVWAVTAAH